MRKERFVEGEYYHIYNRGVDRRIVFNDDRDRIRFLRSLHVLNNFITIPFRFDFETLEPSKLLTARKNPMVSIVAGCLMPTHFHLLLTPLEENGVSSLLHKVGVSYAMYFNKKYERVGRLFESTFHAKHVKEHEYATYLTRYIHLNPIKLFQTKSGTEIMGMLEKYPWSSCADYFGKESMFSILLVSSFRNDVLDMDSVQYKDCVFSDLDNVSNVPD